MATRSTDGENRYAYEISYKDLYLQLKASNKRAKHPFKQRSCLVDAFFKKQAYDARLNRFIKGFLEWFNPKWKHSKSTEHKFLTVTNEESLQRMKLILMKSEQVTYEDLYYQLKNDKKLSGGLADQYNCLEGAFFSDQLDNADTVEFLKDFFNWFNRKWTNSGCVESNFLTINNEQNLKMHSIGPFKNHKIHYEDLYFCLRATKNRSKNPAQQFNCLMDAFFKEQTQNSRAISFVKAFILWFNPKWKQSRYEEKKFLNMQIYLTLKNMKFIQLKTDEITYENLYDQLKKDKKMSENREVQYNCLIGAFFSDQLNNLHAAKFIKDFLTWFNAKWENSGRSEKDFFTKDNQLSLKMQKFTPIITVDSSENEVYEMSEQTNQQSKTEDTSENILQDTPAPKKSKVDHIVAPSHEDEIETSGNNLLEQEPTSKYLLPVHLEGDKYLENLLQKIKTYDVFTTVEEKLAKLRERYRQNLNPLLEELAAARREIEQFINK